ncbi:MAG: hypothetical protein ACLP8S_07355 [Solirubrobacteraceae bacterium]|jgi:hypothetical protein
MTEITTKTPRVVKTQTDHQLGISAAGLSSVVVDRATMLSEEVLKSLETSERAAVEALGQFVTAIEEAFPQQVAGTSDVAKKITESGLQMADRLVHAQHDFLCSAIGRTAKSLSIRDGAKIQTAE